jgi:hypothetical protein
MASTSIEVRLLINEAYVSLSLPGRVWDPVQAAAAATAHLDLVAQPACHYEFVFHRADTGDQLGEPVVLVDGVPVVVLVPAQEETAADVPADVPATSPSICFNDVDLNTTDPLIVTATWRLTVAGLKAPYLVEMPRAEQARIAAFAQHDGPNGEANEDWLASRVGRLTGSVVGAIYGVNPYSSPHKQLGEFMWKKFKGNAACRYGNEHEDYAEASFRDWQLARLLDSETDAHGFVLLDLEVVNKGLCICRTMPFMAMSPDGFLIETWRKSADFATETEARAAAAAQAAALPTVHAECPRPVPVVTAVQAPSQADGPWCVEQSYELRILVEYKCPYRQRYRSDWTPDEDVYPVNNVTKAPGVRLPVPSYYYSQVQYGCHVLGVLDDLLTWPTHCWMVVWHPHFNTMDEWPDFRSVKSGEGKAVTVATASGTIQATRVAYNAAYAQDLEKCATKFWHERLMPTQWLKNNNLLEEGEVPYDEEWDGAPPTRKRRRPKATEMAPLFIDMDAAPPSPNTKRLRQTFMNDYIRIDDVRSLAVQAQGQAQGQAAEADDVSDLDFAGMDFMIME